MRSFLVLTAAALVLGGVAHAQTPSASALPTASSSSALSDRGYVQADADLAFGNVNSQSYGAEAGFNIGPTWQVFVEGGRVNSVADDTLGAAAQVIVTYLAQSQIGVTVSVKEPVIFGVGGVRYLVPSMRRSRAQPYLMAGVGAANVKHDVTFKAGGNDITGSLPQLGVTLGSDLAGSFTKPMLVLGGGVSTPIWQRLVLDIHFKFGRVFAEDQGINVSRAGIGLGFRF